MRYIGDEFSLISDQGVQMIEFSDQHPDCLMLTFEECSMKKEKTILRIHEFIRACLPIEDRLSAAELDAIVAKTDFDQMQSNERTHGYKVGRIQPFLFHRSGQVKQWRSYMSEGAFHQLCEMVQKKYKDTYRGILSWEY